MKLSDFLIIYFAAGAPFGMYQITVSRKSRDATNVARIAVYFLLWPLYTILLLSDRLAALGQLTDTTPDQQIEDFRDEIESLAFTDGKAAAIFGFREVFNRYVGLSLAIGSAGGHDVQELVAIAGDTDKVTAAKCIGRRNREKLAFHQTRSRNDFVDLISELVAGQPAILDLAVRVAEVVCDSDAAEELSVLEYQPYSTARAAA